ncbi:hypothetical protein [Kitasatospora sp. NPDC006786]|uniref:hypothetical protein n=1 Tax=unclassified Kitasatospora TaxID=2633591 RepID=UPI0033DED7D7
MSSSTDPTAAEITLDAAVPADVDVPALPTEVLASIHALDLDVLVPASEWWRTATRRAARRLINQMGPMLRHLVAEIVTMDRQLADADAELEQLRTEVTELRSAARVPSDDPITAAHAIALRLAQQLTPPPSSTSVQRYRWELQPRVIVTAYEVDGAIESWARHLGVDLQWKTSSSGRSRSATGECTVDNVIVEVTVSERMAPTAVAS